MKVFISWSGELSRKVGESLKKYLPCMIQDLDVFLSKNDLESGGRWGAQLSAELESTSYGIICLTPENQTAPWILFEAGALTKLSEGKACGLLLGGLTPANVSGPLAQFQHRKMNREDFSLLLRDINGKLSSPLKEQQLHLVESKWWPDLEKDYESFLIQKPIAAPAESAPSEREDRELLEEILEHIRYMSKPKKSARENARMLIHAESAVIRIVEALPQDEYDVLLHICRLKQDEKHDEVEAYAVQEADIIDSLTEKGIALRDDDDRLRVARYVAEVVLKKDGRPL